MEIIVPARKPVHTMEIVLIALLYIAATMIIFHFVCGIWSIREWKDSPGLQRDLSVKIRKIVSVSVIRNKIG